MAEKNKYIPLNNTVTQDNDELYTLRLKENGVPVDASTWEFFHTVKQSLDDTDAEALSALDPADFTFSNYEGTNDQVNWTVTAASTAAMPVGDMFQSLKVIRSGIKRTYGKGQFVVEDAVTDRDAPLP